MSVMFLDGGPADKGRDDAPVWRKLYVPRSLMDVFNVSATPKELEPALIVPSIDDEGLGARDLVDMRLVLHALSRGQGFNVDTASQKGNSIYLLDFEEEYKEDLGACAQSVLGKDPLGLNATVLRACGARGEDELLYVLRSEAQGKTIVAGQSSIPEVLKKDMKAHGLEYVRLGEDNVAKRMDDFVDSFTNYWMQSIRHTMEKNRDADKLHYGIGKQEMYMRTDQSYNNAANALALTSVWEEEVVREGGVVSGEEVFVDQTLGKMLVDLTKSAQTYIYNNIVKDIEVAETPSTQTQSRKFILG